MTLTARRSFVSILIFLDSSFLWCWNQYFNGTPGYGLNPYFPGFIFLIRIILYPDNSSDSMSQSLFSWIHLSYNKKEVLILKKLEFVSILIFLDSSFLCNKFSILRRILYEMSQSLFSWIHLSYSKTGERRGNETFRVSILIFLDSSFL